MQAAEEQSRSQSQGDGSGPGFLSSGKAFALLIGVILLIGIIIFVTRPDPPGGSVTYPGNADPPTFELTDAEALARFQHLDDLRVEAYRESDPSLVPLVFAPESAIADKVRDELRELRRDNVRVRSTLTTLELEVVKNNADSIELLQVVEIRPRFISESGRNVTRQTEPVVQTIEWVLELSGGQWLISDAVITESEIRD